MHASINQSINPGNDNSFITIIIAISVVIAVKGSCSCFYNTAAHIRHFMKAATSQKSAGSYGNLESTCYTL